MMRYRSFTIHNYRAISSDLVIDLSKTSIMPIIGVNESGKTTILHAIFAFDKANDKLNQGRHMEDTANLYEYGSTSGSVSATIEFDQTSVGAQCKGWAISGWSEEDLEALSNSVIESRGTLTIKRDLESRQYSFSPSIYDNPDDDHAAGSEFVRQLPWILFFDDFRDSVDDYIEITKSSTSVTAGWMSIIEKLFEKAIPAISPHDIPSMEDRRRDSVLSRVNTFLNQRLTKAWSTFHLEHSSPLTINIKYEQRLDTSNQLLDYLKLSIAEETSEGTYFFHIRDRSKGFFWFFNFVMKLEFNPKTIDDSGKGTVFLLDEPGSYLHSAAQKRLSNKLMELAEDNHVIYCTHSHYLLSPDVIPLRTIRIADKTEDGNVTLQSIYDYRGGPTEQRSAFQPILDALEVQSFGLEFRTNETVLITEGIYDKYSIDLFKQNRRFIVLPSANADSIQYHISRLVAEQIPFKALWDNDPAGQEFYRKASKEFGPVLAGEHFYLLPKPAGKTGHRRIQSLFDKVDMDMFKQELPVAKNSSFEKTIVCLYHDHDRERIMSNVSSITKNNFIELFHHLDL